MDITIPGDIKKMLPKKELSKKKRKELRDIRN